MWVCSTRASRRCRTASTSLKKSSPKLARTNDIQRSIAKKERVTILFSSPLAPHIPVWDKSARHDGSFSRADFVFDPARNIYICPGGAELTSAGNIDQGHIGYYRASKNDCA